MFGPYSTGSLFWGYRCGLRELGVDATTVILTQTQWNFPTDINLNFSSNQFLSILQQTNQLRWFVRNFDIFHFVYSHSLLPYPINFDVPILKLVKKKIVMHFVGSDIRCNPDVLSGVMDKRDCNYCIRPCMVEKKIRRVKFWARNADMIMSGVDNSQILDHLAVPYRLITLPFDLHYWKRFESTMEVDDNLGPLIVHAPTRPGPKGTHILLDAIRRLKEDGYRVNVKIFQNEPNSIIREWLNIADIVFDQIGRGWHGTFAVEGMAMGKPVLGYIRDDYRQKYRRGFPNAPRLPIISVTSDNLYTEIKSLIDDLSRCRRIERESRRYVERVHDQRKICEGLLKMYEKVLA